MSENPASGDGSMSPASLEQRLADATTRLQELEFSAADWKARYTVARDNAEGLEKARKRLLGEKDSLVQALGRYGRHLDTCRSLTTAASSGGAACDCGFAVQT